MYGRSYTCPLDANPFFATQTGLLATGTPPLHIKKIPAAMSLGRLGECTQKKARPTRLPLEREVARKPDQAGWAAPD